MWLRPCVAVGYQKPDFTTLEEKYDESDYMSFDFGITIAVGIVVGAVVIVGYIGKKKFDSSYESHSSK